MRICRVRTATGSSFGVLEDDEVILIDGLPTSGAVSRGAALHSSDAQLLAPVAPSKIMGVGRNYTEHIAEMGYETPQRPSLFMKPPTALLDPGAAVVLPPESEHVEHEAELAVVIGRVARRIRPEQAAEHILGVTCANDVSARDLQRSDDSVIRGKGFDTFCPVGPWIETDLDPRELDVSCRVNGEVRQHGSTATLLFDVPTIVSYLSAFTTLLPGDLILTGSPGGSQRLRPGDRVEIEISGVGTLEHGVEAG